jgi:molybdate transport system ATP-binding protein
VTALFGPSGSGKSTIVRMIAGLERPERGRIVLGSRVLLDTATRTSLAPWRRRIGLVFQDAKLFPHLSVHQNLLYSHLFKSRTEGGVDLDAVVAVLGIGHLMGRLPHTLSGGERQRVALGRAMLATPRLLVMDEPLASLDATRRQEILPFIERLRDEFSIPMLYVSHALDEVERLAARVVRLENGRVRTVGTPAEVLRPPLAGEPPRGTVSTLNAEIVRHDAEHGVTLLRHAAGEIVVPGIISQASGFVRVNVHASDVMIAIGPPGKISLTDQLRGRVLAMEQSGAPFVLVTLRLEGGECLRAYLTSLAAENLGLAIGTSVVAFPARVTWGDGGWSRQGHSEVLT